MEKKPGLNQFVEDLEHKGQQDVRHLPQEPVKFLWSEEIPPIDQVL